MRCILHASAETFQTQHDVEGAYVRSGVTIGSEPSLEAGVNLLLSSPMGICNILWLNRIASRVASAQDAQQNSGVQLDTVIHDAIASPQRTQHM